uniref:Uncharacterized protein n=1 Tax=Panagrolaimus sp. JU765 TaxID=591449 RepID=A0AC34Q1H9_9BILA
MAFPGFLNVLCKASRFVKTLTLWSLKLETDGFLEFYKKLEHLEKLELNLNSLEKIDFPYFPSKIILIAFNGQQWLIPMLIQKTKNCPLSYLHFETSDFFDTTDFVLQQLFQLKFVKGAQIYADVGYMKFMLTYLGGNMFEIEAAPYICSIIYVDQQLNKNNQRILKLTDIISIHFSQGPDSHRENVIFHVTSASSPKRSIFTGVFDIASYETQEFVIENIDEKDWIRIDFEKADYTHFPIAQAYYSRKMLDHYFPKNESTIHFERCKMIMKNLGCEIYLSKRRKLIKRFKQIYSQLQQKY